MPVGLRLLGVAFLPLLACVLALLFSAPGSFGPGLTHGVILGSLVLVAC